MAGLKPFEYSKVALPHGKDHIRLLRLEAGLHSRPIRATLVLAALSDQPVYEALSYTWGGSSENRTVILNGTAVVPVTNNLFRALRGIRRHTRTVTLWVDALCINQADNEERSSQVAMMYRIYQEARRVLVWLGDPVAHDASSFLWRLYVGLLKPAVKTAEVIHLRLLLGTTPKDGHRAFYVACRGGSKNIERALANTTPTWHHRAWVVQEYILGGRFGARVQFCTGSQKWSLADLRAAQSRSPVGSEDSRLSALYRAMDDRYSGFYYSPFYRSYQDAGMLEAVELTRGLEATDSRDLVYSVFGLIGRREVDIIGVDYSRTLEDLCARATYASIKARRSHAILRYVHLSCENQRCKPTSWAVDFASELPRVSLSGTATERKTYGSPRLQGDLASSIAFNTTTGCLSLPAVRCGSVVRTIRTSNRKETLDCGDAGASESRCRPVTQASRALVMRQIQLAEHYLDEALSASPPVERSGRPSLSSPSPQALLIDAFLSERSKTIGVNRALRTSDSIAGLQDADEEAYSKTYFCNGTTMFFKAHSDIVKHLLGLEPAATEMLQTYSERDPTYFAAEAQQTSGGLSLFLMQGDLLGCAPCSIAAGEEIVAVPFADVSTSPFVILRPCERGYRFRGLAFVQGCTSDRFWEGLQGLEDLGEIVNIY